LTVGAVSLADLAGWPVSGDCRKSLADRGLRSLILWHGDCLRAVRRDFCRHGTVIPRWYPGL